MRFIETCVRVRKNAQIFGKRSAPSRKTPPQAYHEIHERNIRIEHMYRCAGEPRPRKTNHAKLVKSVATRKSVTLKDHDELTKSTFTYQNSKRLKAQL